MLEHSMLEHSKLDHSKLDHSKLDRSKLEHSKLEHSKPERSKTEAVDLAARIVAQMRDLGFRHKLGRSSRIRLGSLETNQSEQQASSTLLSNGRGSNAQASNTRASNAQASNAQASNAQASNAQASNTRASNTRASNARGTEIAEPAVREPIGEQPQAALQDAGSSNLNLPLTDSPTELPTKPSAEVSLDLKIRNTYSLYKLDLNTGTDPGWTEALPQRSSVPQPLAAGYIDTGCPGLGRLLPGGGYERGSLVEWFAQRHGSGVSSLSLLAAASAMKDGKALVVMDWQGTFYPPSAAALGIDLQRVVVVRPLSREDGWWGLDQALRCPAIGAVWSELPEEMDDRLARRLQLAAEEGGTLGLFVRDIRTRGRPSWADVQWLVRSEPFDSNDSPKNKPLNDPLSYPTNRLQQNRLYQNQLDQSNPASCSNLLSSHSNSTSTGRCVQVELLRCRSGAGHGGNPARRRIRLELGHKPHSLYGSQEVWVRELPPLHHERDLKETAKTTPEITTATTTAELKSPNRVNGDRASGPLRSNLLRDNRDNNTLPNGLNRNDSHGDRLYDTHTKHLAAQLAMPACTSEPADTPSARALGA